VVSGGDCGGSIILARRYTVYFYSNSYVNENDGHAVSVWDASRSLTFTLVSYLSLNVSTLYLRLISKVKP